MDKSQIIKIADFIWEIPQSYRPDMRVAARILATEKMLMEILGDRSLDQLVNVTTLAGIQKYAIVMPDVHEGYGFPIGAVAATLLPDGVISPGGIGYDINCGLRLLKSNIDYFEIKKNLPRLGKLLYQSIPSGVGRSGSLNLSFRELDKVLEEGVKWMVKQGLAEASDEKYIESAGKIKMADAKAVSAHAKQRGKDQLGTMGAGNHFVEIDRVEAIFNEPIARVFALRKDQIVILIHTGSRGLGHQVATDYIRLMLNSLAKYKIQLPDLELACAPFSSPEGQRYFSAMAAAANFAFANRQLIAFKVRQVWRKFFGESLMTLYDVAHNIAKKETYEVNGKMREILVHRKGATRAFGPNNPEIPQAYRQVGQPVLIPGSMGTASYVLVGTARAVEISFGTTCHGAGRTMSRKQAKREISGKILHQQLLRRGIDIQTSSLADLAEEAPLAYKDIDEVVEVVDHLGIAQKVVRLRPLVVIKG